MVFCRTELFTSKSNICGSALVLTQFQRKVDAAEWCADLAQETLGGEVWHRRLEATVADGEETLADARFMSCARGDAPGSLAAARFSKKSLSESV